jgi:pyruvate,water dikinase
MVGSAKITEAMLSRFLSAKVFKGEFSSGMFLRGFPSKTGQAQESLERIAQRVCSSEELTALVLGNPAQDLLDLLQAQQSGELFEEIGAHLETYGHQIYNLDFVEQTQGEAPLPLLLSLQARVGSGGDDQSFTQRQAEMLDQGQRLVRQTRAMLGPVRRWIFGKLLGWAEKFAPNREESLFYMGAAWPALRRLAFTLGDRLVEVGTLASANGVFYLTGDELTQASTASEQGKACPELATKAQQREALREARKRLHPPARVPEDLRFKFGPFDFTRMFEVWETQKHNRDDTDTLSGFAVSPGRVTGKASVILSPADFSQMAPGTILVCPTTTPAWTPLFTQALALVTDIGGILAHGSIIAREYGIPAVLGTGNGTERIVSGQVITVDGTAGTVTIVE